MQGVRKMWKESASLILLSKSPAVVEPSSKFNYDILAIKRSTGSKFMPNAIVFPGGVIEPADSTRNWLDLYSKLGVRDARLAALRCDQDLDFIYQKNSDDEQIERALSLRISAIRETFEEVGILLAKGQKDLAMDASGLYAVAKSGFDITHWQKEVRSDSGKFFDLCELLKVVPDVFSLHSWSNWLTPTSIGKHRFDTVFFTASLQERPPLTMDTREVQHVVVS